MDSSDVLFLCDDSTFYEFYFAVVELFHLVYFDGDFLGEPTVSIFYPFDVGFGDFDPGFGDFAKLRDLVSFFCGGSAT